MNTVAGWSRPFRIGLFVVGILVLAAGLVWQRQTDLGNATCAQYQASNARKKDATVRAAILPDQASPSPTRVELARLQVSAFCLLSSGDDKVRSAR